LTAVPPQNGSHGKSASVGKRKATSPCWGVEKLLKDIECNENELKIDNQRRGAWFQTVIP
jgi:hypothetical protein